MKLQPQSSKPITLITRIEHKSSLILLDYLLKRFPYHTGEEWQERIEDGRVKVNGIQTSPGQPLRPGDEIAYTTKAWQEPEVNTHYRVVLEDEALLVLSKPAPLPVHAIGGYFQNTLMHILRRDRPEAQNYHLAHRLDSETSGLLLLVKDKKYLKSMRLQWESGMVRKTYQAIVFGKFPHAHYLLDAPIGKPLETRIRMKMAVNEETGRPSNTEFKCLKVKGNYSFLNVYPRTGRTHQIRVHLEHLGFPIVGDKLYSGNEEIFLHFYEFGWDEWIKEKILLNRTALHAFKLEIVHPLKGEKVVLEDPFPEDLSLFWESL